MRTLRHGHVRSINHKCSSTDCRWNKDYYYYYYYYYFTWLWKRENVVKSIFQTKLVAASFCNRNKNRHNCDFFFNLSFVLVILAVTHARKGLSSSSAHARNLLRRKYKPQSYLFGRRGIGAKAVGSSTLARLEKLCLKWLDLIAPVLYYIQKCTYIHKVLQLFVTPSVVNLYKKNPWQINTMDLLCERIMVQVEEGGSLTKVRNASGGLW